MNNKSILVADDDQDIINYYKEVLENKGYNVVTANTGKEALEEYKKNKFDVIFLDMMMEKVNTGIETCKEIRKTNKDVKIYLFSDVGDESTKTINIHEVGFNGALQKPVKPEELISLAE